MISRPISRRDAGSFFPEYMQNAPSIEMIMIATALEMDVEVTDIMGKSRKSRFAEARRIVSGISRRFGWNLARIGKAMNRDHSTVMYQIDKFEHFLKNEDEYRDLVEQVQKKLKTIFKATNIMNMKKVNFEEAPNLWPEEYTDHFVFDANSDKELLEECLDNAIEAADTPIYELRGLHLFTRSQILVDELKDQLYGYEIAFQHTHIPEFYG
jgi:hypothetical protein